MKAITTTLYLCGGLMAAAAVMGAIDYKLAKHKGSLDNLYKEEKEKPVIPLVKKAKAIEIEDYSRKAIDMRVEEPAPKKKESVTKSAIPKHEPAEEVVNKTDEIGVAEQPVVKKKRKVKFSQFSRAALPRRYEKEEVMDTTEAKVWKY